MSAIDKVIEIAKGEVGYLEKRSNASLYNKTANAGSGNYTKYWAEIKPDYQGQPWCACFVTWVFTQAFGKDKAEKMLKHYPYVYCPTMAQLFTLNANPKAGDIVIFYRGGTFTHTGIVTGVYADYFTTIEGNTSSGNDIIANGGAVCAKGYYNSALPGTKFCTPDWSIAESEDKLMSKEYDELKHLMESKDDIINKMGEEIAELKLKTAEPMIYNYIDENMPEWYRPTVQKLVSNGILKGNENGELMLTEDMMRMLTVLDRVGLFD